MPKNRAYSPKCTTKTGSNFFMLSPLRRMTICYPHMVRAKWKRCLRTSSDCVFFAGPCAGGSPWNRLNKRVGEETASSIEWKAFVYWELWEEFAECLNHAIFFNAMALLELPKGFPKVVTIGTNKRMTSMINGTD